MSTVQQDICKSSMLYVKLIFLTILTGAHTHTTHTTQNQSFFKNWEFLLELTLPPVMGQFQLLGLLLVGVDQELFEKLALLAEVQVPDLLLLRTVGVDHVWPLFCVLRHDLLDLRGERGWCHLEFSQVR